MPTTRHAAWLGLAVLLAGCQSRLSVNQTYTLTAGEAREFEIDPPRYQQRVALTIESDASVAVYLFLKQDTEALIKDLALKQKSDKALAAWSGGGSGTVEATVPAHQVAVVRVEAGPKPAHVTIKVIGK